MKGKPESQGSKIARMFGQLLGKGTQALAESGLVENEQANTVIGAAGATVQEQAEMDPTETSASKSMALLIVTGFQYIHELATYYMTMHSHSPHVIMNACGNALCECLYGGCTSCPILVHDAKYSKGNLSQIPNKIIPLYVLYRV